MTSYKEDLGRRLKVLFEKKKIVKSHFAKNIGRKHENILRWLRGDHTPDAEALGKIAKVLPNLNMRWLLTGAGRMEETFTSPMKEAAKRFSESKKGPDWPHTGPELESLVKFELHEKELHEAGPYAQELRDRGVDDEEYEKKLGKLLVLQLKRRYAVIQARMSFGDWQGYYDREKECHPVIEDPETFFEGSLDVLIHQKNEVPNEHLDKYLELEEEIREHIEADKGP